MEAEYLEEERYLRAQKQVKKLKGFYWHLFWYLAVNIWMTLQRINFEVFTEEGINKTLFEFEIYATWFFWGIGIVFHGIHVLGKNVRFTKEWEERKIKEFMDKE
ncbi:2TM domain-containing protein [Flavicella sediminum]|uniref:2TM domain-containing protein n=1 Tax=Flavicella sediminum TaxID=2585141 RepID=UPI00111DB3FF|nr:2TM domain-containing protein [Flavicella sediminum]